MRKQIRDFATEGKPVDALGVATAQAEQVVPHPHVTAGISVGTDAGSES